MKGIILAGGAGTRLHPLTLGVSKQLMPIYDKPMIYYPLATLMAGGIKSIIIITTPEDKSQFVKTLGDGKQFGCEFTYLVQEKPNGIAQAFIIAEHLIQNDDVTLILGDNIFHGKQLNNRLKTICSKPIKGATVFAYHVNDPERYGVVEFNYCYDVVSLEEKPVEPKSNYAVCGLYVYDKDVIKYTKELIPSKRGELEITDLNKTYLSNGSLKVELLADGVAWLDTGTFNSLQQANNYIHAIQERQGLKVACIEEIAYKNGFINREELKLLAQPLLKSGYGEYLLKIYNKHE